MSNPNVNISNLDGRYSKPADVSAAIAAQATTDAGQYAQLPGSSRNKLTGFFHVEGYGAKGDGVTDDTAAFQAAASAAISAKGTMYIPQPASSYVLSSTVLLQPSSGSQFFMSVRAEGPFTAIRWTGANNTSMFRSLGWKRSKIENVQIRLDTTASGIVVWDIDGDASTYTSTSHLTFDACHVTITSLPTSVTGWRFGHNADNNTDFSYIAFLNCTDSSPTGVSGNGGHVGWRVESANALQFQWFGGGGYNLATTFSNVQSSGANVNGVQGGPTMYFYGFGDSGCLLDYELHTQGQYIVSGGRFELGSRFCDIGTSGSLAGSDLEVTAADLASYNPSDGIVFNLNGSSSLTLDGVEVRPPAASADYTAAMITANGASTGRGAITVRGGKFRAPDPFFTIASGSYSVDISQARYISSTLQVTAWFKRQVWSTAAAPSNDLLALAQNIGSVGSSAFIAFQGGSPGSARARVGFDGSNGRTTLSDAATGRNVTLESGTTARQLVTATSTGNVHLDAIGATDGSGVKTVYIANAATIPSVNPVGGGVLYVNNGALVYRGSSGTITTIGPA